MFFRDELEPCKPLDNYDIQRQRRCRQANSKTKLAKSLKIMTIKDSSIVKALTCMNITCTNKYDNFVKETYTSGYKGYSRINDTELISRRI